MGEAKRKRDRDLREAQKRMDRLFRYRSRPDLAASALWHDWLCEQMEGQSCGITLPEPVVEGKTDFSS